MPAYLKLVKEPGTCHLKYYAAAVWTGKVGVHVTRRAHPLAMSIPSGSVATTPNSTPAGLSKNAFKTIIIFTIKQ